MLLLQWLLTGSGLWWSDVSRNFGWLPVVVLMPCLWVSSSSRRFATMHHNVREALHLCLYEAAEASVVVESKRTHRIVPVSSFFLRRCRFRPKSDCFVRCPIPDFRPWSPSPTLPPTPRATWLRTNAASLPANTNCLPSPPSAPRALPVPRTSRKLPPSSQFRHPVLLTPRRWRRRCPLWWWPVGAVVGVMRGRSLGVVDVGAAYYY